MAAASHRRSLQTSADDSCLTEILSYLNSIDMCMQTRPNAKTVLKQDKLKKLSRQSRGHDI